MSTLEYPTVANIHDIHEAVIVEDPDAKPGVHNEGGIDSALQHISEGYFGQGPDGLYEEAAYLMKEIVSRHCYVDGNKRTALNSTEVFYALNGVYFDYGPEIMEILEHFATDAEAVVMSTVVDHCERCAIPEEELDPEAKRELAVLRTNIR